MEGVCTIRGRKHGRCKKQGEDDPTGCGRKACACPPMYAWYGARFLTSILVRASTAALLAEMYRYPIADESNGVFSLGLLRIRKLLRGDVEENTV
jgi:hypothetical protein